MKRSRAVRGIVKGAGAVVLGLIALDLFASAVTLAVSWGFFRR